MIRRLLPVVFLLVLLAAPVSVRAEEVSNFNSASFALDHPNLQRKISLDLKDTNITDAILYLAGKADINIAVSKNVTGRATLAMFVPKSNIRGIYLHMLINAIILC